MYAYMYMNVEPGIDNATSRCGGRFVVVNVNDDVGRRVGGERKKDVNGGFEGEGGDALRYIIIADSFPNKSLAVSTSPRAPCACPPAYAASLRSHVHERQVCHR